MSIMQIGGAVAIVVVAVAVAGNSGRREAPARPAYEIPAYSKALNAQIAAYEAAVGPQAPKTSAEAGGSSSGRSCAAAGAAPINPVPAAKT